MGRMDRLLGMEPMLMVLVEATPKITVVNEEK